MLEKKLSFEVKKIAKIFKCNLGFKSHQKNSKENFSNKSERARQIAALHDSECPIYPQVLHTLDLKRMTCSCACVYWSFPGAKESSYRNGGRGKISFIPRADCRIPVSRWLAVIYGNAAFGERVDWCRADAKSCHVPLTWVRAHHVTREIWICLGSTDTQYELPNLIIFSSLFLWISTNSYIYTSLQVDNINSDQISTSIAILNLFSNIRCYTRDSIKEIQFD